MRIKLTEFKTPQDLQVYGERILKILKNNYNRGTILKIPNLLDKDILEIIGILKQCGIEYNKEDSEDMSMVTHPGISLESMAHESPAYIIHTVFSSFVSFYSISHIDAVRLGFYDLVKSKKYQSIISID